MAYQPEIEKLERQYYDDPARFFAQLADVYRRRGRIDEALTMLREHLAARPNYVSGLVVLGRCLLDQHNDAEARETFERVIAVDREHIIALKALGEIGERMGDATGARQWYQRLLEIDPMNDEAEAALGRIAAMPPPPPPPAVPVVSVEEPVAPAPAAVVEAPEPPLAPPSPAAQVAPPAPLTEPTRFEPEALVPERFEPEAREPEPAEPEAFAAQPEFDTRTGEFPGSPLDAPEEAPWAPAAHDAADDRVEFEDVEGPVLDQSAGDQGDLAGWVEHPEELLTFDEVREAPKDEGDLTVEAFDESLGWGAGERVSRQISPDDLAAAEQAHEDDLAAPVQGLPGLEDEPVPGDADAGLAAAETVDGLQYIETDAAAEPLEGLEPEGAMLMPPEAPPPPAAARPPAHAARDDDDGRASLAGLPVFFPPDEDAREPLRVEPEPEPVVTETMAELYVRQGLLGEARETYRQLLASRPHDRRLAARLAELQESGPTRDARTVYAASASGGQTARAFLSAILGGRGSVEVAGAEMTQTIEVEPEPAPEPAPEPMDEAFADEAEPRGEPTQPAKDEISLAAIFGEQSAAAPAAPAPPPAAPGTRPAGGFSFDEFFAATPPSGAPESAPARPPRDTLSDDEGEEAFRDWLKGLKS